MQVVMCGGDGSSSHGRCAGGGSACIGYFTFWRRALNVHIRALKQQTHYSSMIFIHTDSYITYTHIDNVYCLLYSNMSKKDAECCYHVLLKSISCNNSNISRMALACGRGGRPLWWHGQNMRAIAVYY